MIISASRRTDIPAFYSDWFINRLNAGYCLVKNPFNPTQIKRVSLLPQDVDGIVLWTKNTALLLPKISALDPFSYYFQYSITPYHTDIETGLANKQDVIIPAFLELASKIGAERMIWRYDPIVINNRYTYEYHIGAFTRLCELLKGSTKKCVISFVLAYKSVAKSLREVGSIELDVAEKLLLVESLSEIAKSHEITLCACCELPGLYELGIQPISCVDAILLSKIAQKTLCVPRDKNQRDGCNCAVSVDIGAYNSCINGCQYCYANHVEARVRANYTEHDSNAEML
ncbi:MAG: DUF1848 domain-containing protein [Oscillospiraceae bacterium]|nr:DUF1848 domain-containing protein [Oscillospiraceae bacterium]